MIKVTFLGTNGWYDSKTGNTISILVETPSLCLVLDAGNGFAKLPQYVTDDRPVYVFLSHFHLDHIIGLHTLNKNSFPQGLNFIVHEGGKEILERFLDFPFTAPVSKMPFRTKILEVPKSVAFLPFQAEFLPLVHSSFILGIRVELEGKVIAYCPDTGFCENAVILAKQADLLITECAYRSHEADEAWPHLNPELSARIAQEAGVHKLYLTHFDAEKYPDTASRMEAERASRKHFTESFASMDDMQLEPW